MPLSGTAAKLLTEISPTPQVSSAKVTIVGTGAVGMAGAFSILTMGVASDLALVDARKDAVKGEQMDLMHGQAITGKRCNIVADSDFACTAGSKICVVTAGARQGPGETRLDLVNKNVKIFKSIIPNLVKYNPDCIIIIVTNPCDIMAWVTMKLSGFPKHRVFGSGTTLDTSRFKYLLSERFGIGAHSVHGYIIGEHGDSSVACWSSVNVSGTLLRSICPTAGSEEEGKDPENWAEIHTEVVQAAYNIIGLKGYTSWGIGVMIAKICDVILRNQRTVLTVSTLADGWNGIHEEVCLSMPCVVGETGLTHVINQALDEDEKAKVMGSVATMRKVMDGIQL